MVDVAVSAEGLGKRYRLGEREPYRNLAEVLTEVAKRPFGVRSRNGGRAPDYLWALSDVSFEVRRGEAFGVIGANGAGKSTLLKVLSRITRPTTGQARLRGRVASLIEVGTGFHEELTGRENIFLNGGVLGMKRREIERRFDEIVEFSGVERFLDTPVKRYSSGMYVRLAFAVAAHLEPEILIVDEVLAVGDVQFQRKCLGKMDTVAREGRTILFVSHNMNAVQRLCSRALALKTGRIAMEGATHEVIAWYLSDAAAVPSAARWVDAAELRREHGTGEVRVVALSCRSDAGQHQHRPYPNGPLEVNLLLESDSRRDVGSVALTIRDQLGTRLLNADVVTLGEVVPVAKGRTLVTFNIASLHLTPGTYVLGWWISNAGGYVYDVVERALQLDVVDIARPGLGARTSADGVVTCEFTVSSEPHA